MNSNKIALSIAGGVCLLAGLFFSATLAEGDYLKSVLMTLTVFGVGWIVLGSRFWWLPLPFALVLGGVFQLIFKIYPYELALAAGVVALLPGVILNFGGFYKQRDALPLSIMLLLFYLSFHWAGSLAYNKYLGIGGWGNVTRSYGAALWVVIFIVLFHWFGNTKQIRFAFWLMYVAMLLRLAGGLYTQFTSDSFTVPIINYVPQGAAMIQGEPGSLDLRYSGLLLGGFSLALFPLAKSIIPKSLLLFAFSLSLPILVLGGGRGPVVMWFFYPLFFCIIYRKFLLLTSFVVLTGIVIAFININPEVIEELPIIVQRSVSILIFKSDTSTGHILASQSNIFHKRFTEEAYNRWTQNYWTTIFGTGIRPSERGFDLGTNYGSGDFGIWLEAVVTTAANTGNYEKGLWTVLAVTGIVGLLLYLNVFRWMFWKVGWDLFKNKISTPGRACGYIGLVTTTIWLVLGWKLGSYPSFEIFFLYLSYQAMADESSENQTVATSLAETPVVTASEGAEGSPAESAVIKAARFPFVKKNLTGPFTPRRDQEKNE